MLKKDINYILFSELYHRLDQPKARRKAYYILEVAIDCFAKHGLDKTSLSTISRISAIKKTTLLYYFQSFEELKIFTMKYLRLLYQRHVVSELEKADRKDFKDLFFRYWNACFSWPKHHPKHSAVWVAFLQKSITDNKIAAINTEAVDQGLERLQEIIKVSDPKKQKSKERLEQLSLVIHTIITGQILCEATERRANIIERRHILKLECFILLGLPTEGS